MAEGQANTAPYIFYLPAIDQPNTPINPNGPTDVTSARAPGLKMTIPQGVSLRVLDGDNNPLGPVTHVSITPVPIDRTPAPLPLGVAATMVYTSQPGNSCVWNPTGGPSGNGACFLDDSGPKIPDPVDRRFQFRRRWWP